MFNIIFRRSNTFIKNGISNRTIKRFFLSNSYACTEAWNNRLKLPVLQKIDVEDLYYQLDRNLQIGRKVSVLDIDLFANGISADGHLEILEDILFKLRLNPECGALLDSTNHAVVRWYWALKQKNNLLNVLSERLTYGVFLDYYLTNLLIDTYLKENDVLSATKVAVLQMLQEDCKHPITTPFALHACYKYLNSSEVWPPPPPEEEVDEDEQIKVRVLFLRNPYFDDHFDIIVPNHLVGKTMVLFGRELDGPIGVSSQIIGYSLYEKHNENIDLLENVLNKKISVHSEALAKAKEYTQKKPKQVEASESKDDGEGKEDKNEEIEKAKGTVVKLIEEIEKLKIAKDSSLETETAELVKKAVQEYEDVEIKNQLQV